MDGTFDVLGAAVGISQLYPAIDGVPLRALEVRVSLATHGGTISYRTLSGTLEISLEGNGDRLTLQAVWTGTGVAPGRIDPLASGKLHGVERFFHQGLGFGGPTGFARLPSAGMLESFALGALVAPDDSTLVVTARDQRRFQHALRCAPGDRGSAPRFSAGFATEGIPLSGPLTLPEIELLAACTPWEGLSQAARAIGEEMRARTRHPATYHWCSWYYLYYNFSEKLLEEYLDGFKRLSPAVPLQAIQIDVCYFPSAGDWLDPHPQWPGGLEAAFKRIREFGYRPGVWVGPYMVGNRSRLFKEHPEWLLRDNAGKLLTPWRNFNENKVWGLRDEETYVLDTSHPGAMEYLRVVFRTLRKWGATFFKTDFMLWGLVDSMTVKRHAPGKTSTEYLRDLLAVIRAEIGEESYWLGCIAPFAPMIGFADGMRIAADLAALWPQPPYDNIFREAEGDQYFNNVWWQNDPDAIILRNFHSELSEAEVRSFALWHGILGGSVSTSDPLHEVDPARLALWRFVEPGPEKWTGRVPYFGKDRRFMVVVRHFEIQRAWAVLVFNPCHETVMERLEIADLVGRENAAIYEWGPQTARNRGRSTALVVELAGHASMLYYLSAGDPPPPVLTLGGAMQTK